MPTQPDTVFDRILRAMRPVDATAPYGGWALNVTGGGSGGTSMIDNSAFTPGATSITPIGGYYGGRSIASGNAAIPALSGSAILQVDVVAGGAGGGAAQNQMQGTAGNWVNVGVASGAAGAAGNWALPVVQASGQVFTVNIGAGGGGFASAAVYGSPANPVYNIGSVNVVNAVDVKAPAGSMNVIGSVGATQLGAPWSMVGSAGVTPLATFTVSLDKIPTVNLGSGTVNVGNVINAVSNGSMMGIMTVNLASHIDTSNSAVRVNVVTGGAGGGNADLQVRGTGNSAYHVGYASNNLGAWPNYDGGAWLPIMFPSGFYPTVNIGAGGGGGTGFASVAVYGSPANPVYVIGSVNAVGGGGSVGAVNLGGSVGALGIGGSMGVTQIGAPWTVTGSVGVTPLATFTVNLATALDKTNDSITVYQGAAASLKNQSDTSAGITATQWPFSFGGSGYFAIATPSANPTVNAKFFAVHVSTAASVRLFISFQSPSGTFLTGSIPIPPGAGFNLATVIKNPIWTAGGNATVFIHASGTENIAGWLTGYVE